MAQQKFDNTINGKVNTNLPDDPINGMLGNFIGNGSESGTNPIDEYIGQPVDPGSAVGNPEEPSQTGGNGEEDRQIDLILEPIETYEPATYPFSEGFVDDKQKTTLEDIEEIKSLQEIDDLPEDIEDVLDIVGDELVVEEETESAEEEEPEIEDIPEDIDDNITEETPASPRNRWENITKFDWEDRPAVPYVDVAHWTGKLHLPKKETRPLEFWHQKECIKKFDTISYSANPNYLSKLYKEMRDSYAEAIRYDKKTTEILDDFEHCASNVEQDNKIHFHGLDEEKTNVIGVNSQSTADLTYSVGYLLPYYNATRLTNSDIYFKTSPNVGIDCDGRVHFIDNNIGYITAYLTCNSSVYTTVKVRPDKVLVNLDDNTANDKANIRIKMSMSYSDSLSRYNGQDEDRMIMSPSKYSNFTGEKTLFFLPMPKNTPTAQETAGSGRPGGGGPTPPPPPPVPVDFTSGNYICKMYIDNGMTVEDVPSLFIPCHGNFHEEISGLSNASIHPYSHELLYVNLDILERDILRLKFVVNSITATVAPSQQYVLVIYKDKVDDDSIFYRTNITFDYTVESEDKQRLDGPLYYGKGDDADIKFSDYIKDNPQIPYNSLIPLNVHGEHLTLCSLNVENSVGSLSEVMPKTKISITRKNCAALLCVGNGSFRLNYTVYNRNSERFESYYETFNVKLGNVITDNKDFNESKLLSTVESDNIDVVVRCSLGYPFNSSSDMLPVTISAQFNVFTQRTDNMLSSNLIDRVITQYDYIDVDNYELRNEVVFHILMKTHKPCDGIMPIRVYMINYDNSILYFDNSKCVLTLNETGSRSLLDTNVENIPHKFTANLDQQIYSIEKRHYFAPSIKLSLSLDNFVGKEITRADNISIKANHYDIDKLTGGILLTKTQRKRIGKIARDTKSTFDKELSNSTLDGNVPMPQSSMDLSQMIQNNVIQYLKDENLYNEDTMLKIGNLSTVDDIKTNVGSNVLASSNATTVLSSPIYSLWNNKEDRLSVVTGWNVIPLFKISNPTVVYNVEERYGKLANGFMYNINEKNYDITFRDSLYFDSSSNRAKLYINITDDDNVCVTFNFTKQNVCANGQMITSNFIECDSLYISGCIDGHNIEQKFATNCTLDTRTGKLSVTDVTDNVVSIILTGKDSKKQVSLTFIADEYNVVTDDILFKTDYDRKVIDNTNNKTNAIYHNVIGKSIYNPIQGSSYDIRDLNEELNFNYNDIWVKFSGISWDNFGLSKTVKATITNKFRNIDRTKPNCLCLCDIVSRYDSIDDVVYLNVTIKYAINTDNLEKRASRSLISPALYFPNAINSWYLPKSIFDLYAYKLGSDKVVDNSLYNVLNITKDRTYTLYFDVKKLFRNYIDYVSKGNTEAKDGYIDVDIYRNETCLVRKVGDKVRQAVRLTDLTVNVFIMIKNKMVRIMDNVPVTQPFTFCYNDWYDRYGFINHLIITDSNNNVVDSFQLNVTFDDYYSGATTLLNRIQKIPVVFFDDACSNFEVDGDYDNLLPNFTFYRDTLTGGLQPSKLGAISKDIATKKSENIDLSYSLGVVKGSPMFVGTNNNILDNKPTITTDKTIIESKFAVPTAALNAENNLVQKFIEFTPYAAHNVKLKKAGDTNITAEPLALQYVGYIMYYLNMMLLKRLGWNTENDSEDMAYYILLLDRLNNCSSIEDIIKCIGDADLTHINKSLLFGSDDNLSTNVLSNIDFFKRNYKSILKFWQDRINAYELIEEVLKEYDANLDTTTLLDKYIDKIVGLGWTENKKEKIYAILSQEITTSRGKKKRAVSQIDGRIWDVNTYHAVWKNVFSVLFGDIFDINIINDAILRDIYNYGLYPAINVPEMDENRMFVPYILNTAGTFQQLKNADNRLVWNAAKNPLYRYDSNYNIIRSVFLQKPLERTWKITRPINLNIKDNNGLTIIDYKIIGENGDFLGDNNWGYLTTEEKRLKYIVQSKAKIGVASKQTQNILHKITRSGVDTLVPATLDDITTYWAPNIYYGYVQINPELAYNLVTQPKPLTVYRRTKDNRYVEAKKEDVSCTKNIDYATAFTKWKPNFYFKKDGTPIEFKSQLEEGYNEYIVGGDRYYQRGKLEKALRTTTQYIQVAPHVVRDNTDTSKHFYKTSDGIYYEQITNITDYMLNDIRPTEVYTNWKDNYYFTTDGVMLTSRELIEYNQGQIYQYAKERCYVEGDIANLTPKTISEINELLYSGITLDEAKIYYYNSFTRKYSLVHDRSQIVEYNMVDEDFVIKNWILNGFYVFEPTSSYSPIIDWKPLTWIPNRGNTNGGWRRLYATKNTFYYIPQTYEKVKEVTISRLLSRTSIIEVAARDNRERDYWINEDEANLVRMNRKSLIDAIRVQKLINRLFISELNKTMHMVNVIMKYREMSDIVEGLKKSWPGFINSFISTVNMDDKLNHMSYTLLGFNIDHYCPTYNCIYNDDKSITGVIAYSYDYYDGNKHTIERKLSYNGSLMSMLYESPITTRTSYQTTITHDKVNIHNAELNINIEVPAYSYISSYIADIYKSSVSITFPNADNTTLTYVAVYPKNTKIKPFGIYPWNINKCYRDGNDDNKDLITLTTAWSYALEDLAGLPNFADYDVIANYDEVDGDGLYNSQVIMSKMENANLVNMPAVSLAYNYYPEEYLGYNETSYGKYTAYQFTYSYIYTIEQKTNNDGETNNIGCEFKPGTLNITYISQYDINKYPSLVCAEPIIETDENIITTTFGYTYTYVNTEVPTYTVSYNYKQYSGYNLVVNFNKSTNSVSTSIEPVKLVKPDIDSHTVGLLDTQTLSSLKLNNAKPTTISYMFLTSDAVNLSSDIANKVGNTFVRPSSKFDTGETGKFIPKNNTLFGLPHKSTANKFAYTLSFETSDIKSYAYTIADVRTYLSTLNLMTYTLKYHFTDSPLVSYTFDNRQIGWTSGIRKVRSQVQESVNFFLGSVSQWQVVQDNAREINSVLEEIYNTDIPSDKATKDKYSIYGEDYFYDGRIDRDKPDAKLFWTSSEINNYDAWVMFFDKHTIKNMSKVGGAYVRPFIEIK